MAENGQIRPVRSPIPSALRTQMQHLYSQGCGLIPLGGGDGKRPLVSGWHRRKRLPFEKCVAVMEKHDSLTYGLLLDGLAVVDCDSDDEATRAYVAHQFPPSPLTVQTARGRHLYYRAKGSPGLTPRADGVAIDIKHGRNQFVVGPGSIRPDGTEYGCDQGGLSLAQLPLLATTFKAKSPEFPPRIPKGRRNKTLCHHAIAIVETCDSENELLENLEAYTRVYAEEYESITQKELDGIANWAWGKRCSNQVYVGRNSEVRIHRQALERLRGNDNGADATALYATLIDFHGHRPGKRFAIVPDAMRRDRLIPYGRTRGYKAVETLIELQLLRRVRRSRNRMPAAYQLVSPVVADASSEGREGLSITLMPDPGHERGSA